MFINKLVMGSNVVIDVHLMETKIGLGTILDCAVKMGNALKEEN